MQKVFIKYPFKLEFSSDSRS